MLQSGCYILDDHVLEMFVSLDLYKLSNMHDVIIIKSAHLASGHPCWLL